jgi:hypothetical protein
MQFGDELGPANARHLQTGNDESEIFSEFWLLYETKSFRRIAHSLHIIKVSLQDRPASEGLEGIIVYEKDCCQMPPHPERPARGRADSMTNWDSKMRPELLMVACKTVHW